MSEESTPPQADISVIVPAHNAADTIARALESVAGQTLLPAEVVVVDDGSTDGTWAAIEACRDMLAPVRLVAERQPQSGAGAARNRALMLATGAYVAFLDADDDWLPEHLAHDMERLQAGGLTLVAHNEWIVEGERRWLNDAARRAAERPDPVVSLYCKGCVSTSTVLARRDAVVAAGGFDPALLNGQDVDLWLAILTRPGARFEVSPEALGTYRLRPGSINTHIARRYRFFMQIAWRWAPAIAARPRGGVRAVVFRVAAIHYAAMRGFVAAGDWTAAVGVCFRAPFNLLKALMLRFTVRPVPRGDYLADASAQS